MHRRELDRMWARGQRGPHAHGRSRLLSSAYFFFKTYYVKMRFFKFFYMRLHYKINVRLPFENEKINSRIPNKNN